LDQLVGDLVQRTVDPCRLALKDAGVSAADVDEVILVGGMTRMPAVHDSVVKLFGKEQSITITASSGLAQDEIERMVNDSERYAEEDARNRREVETRNMAENAAYGAEKLVKDNAETISDELKSEVEVKVAAVKSALEGGDIALIESATAELQTSLQAVGQAVYSQAGAGQEAEAPPDAPEDGKKESDEGTVEGEFREV